MIDGNNLDRGWKEQKTMTESVDADVALKHVTPLVHHRSSSFTSVVSAVLSDGEGARLEARVSLITTTHGREVERMDSVAGCEFVDDRIRLE